MKLERHIDNIKLSSDYRYTYIIAEIGINHNGNLSEALKLIQAAHDSKIPKEKAGESLYTKDLR